MLVNVGYYPDMKAARDARNHFLEEIYGHDWQRIFEDRGMYGLADLAGWGIFREEKNHRIGWTVWPDELDKPIGNFPTKWEAVQAFLNWKAAISKKRGSSNITQGVQAALRIGAGWAANVCCTAKK